MGTRLQNFLGLEVLKVLTENYYFAYDAPLLKLILLQALFMPLPKKNARAPFSL